MITLNLKQGSPEWHAARAKRFTASEAPAMLGLSKYMTRTELLRQKKTGLVPEVDSGTQRLFDRGHEAEAAARPIAESIVDDELFPATGADTIDGLPLLASFDGITMDEGTIFEHKLFNQSLADFILTHDDLPDTHWPQVEHQLLVSGATRCVFMTSAESNGTHIWYTPRPERRQRVIDGWKQFAADLEVYVPEDIKPEPAKAAVESLPAVFVQVQGSLTCQDNIGAFAKELQAFIERVPAKPESDDDFAVCEAAVKTLEKAESALKAAKDSSLGYVQSLGDLHRMLDTQAEIARSNRLRLDKLVKAEKENRKIAIINSVQMEYRSFVAGLQHADYLPALNPDFAGAIKGLKTIASIDNAAKTCMANAKIEATKAQEKVAANMATIEAAGDYAFLFRDIRDLVLKDAELVGMTVKTRIADHQAAETKRIESERERIRAEEQAKAEREAAQKIALERIEAEKVQREEAAKLQRAAEPANPIEVKPQEVARQTLPPVPANDSGSTLTLGQINTRLAPISLSADGLRQLGIVSIGRERSAVLYRESDFQQICAALINHIQSVQLRKAA